MVNKISHAHLNIAMLGHKRIPSREGGIEVVVEELSTRMVRLGHKVTCFNRSGHHVSGSEFDGKKLNDYKGVQLRTVFTINRKGYAAMSSSVFAAVKTTYGKYDIVHFHAEGPCAMLWLPKLAGKKCIVTIHGLDWARSKWGGFASRYIKLGEKIAARYADEIIVLSRNVQEYFKDTYGRDTRFIPNGVEKQRIREADEIKKNFGLEKDNYLLYLGRLVPEKGIAYLIEAYRKVKTDKRLVIAGGTSDTDEYLKKLKVMAAEDKRVLFIGFIQGRMLEELYSNAYVYVLPSDLEGMPLSLLEAMSYGNCCVVSDIPECLEVVEDKAIVFKKGNVVDLQVKLQELVEDSQRIIQYKKSAADYIVSKYNWDEVVDRTIDLYRKR